MSYRGIIIEESLKDSEILKDVEIVSTKICPVTEREKTPWVEQWTLHTVEISAEQIDSMSERLSNLLLRDNWYADFKSEKLHYIVFKQKVFIVDRSIQSQYDAAIEFGIEKGIPKHQLDFV